MKPAVWILLIALGLLFLFFLLPTMIMSYYIYRVLFVRNTPDKWEKECEKLLDDESRTMYGTGDAWEKENRNDKTVLSAFSGKLRLYGEYFDFGFRNAVIIIAGRMESSRYGYYFAAPYKAAGYNVLVIDNRAHGFSDGKRSTQGFQEQYDILAWCRLLHEEHAVERIILHGICIGASTAMFALTNPDCPPYVAGMITEGMYTTFRHSFVNHMILGKHPLFPFTLETMLYIRLFSKGNPTGDGPAKRMSRLRKPALFLHSREDQYSLPDASAPMYEACPAPHRTVWFESGSHSRIKVNHPERYDSEIASFLAWIDDGTSA